MRSLTSLAILASVCSTAFAGSACHKKDHSSKGVNGLDGSTSPEGYQHYSARSKALTTSSHAPKSKDSAHYDPPYAPSPAPSSSPKAKYSKAYDGSAALSSSSKKVDYEQEYSHVPKSSMSTQCYTSVVMTKALENKATTWYTSGHSSCASTSTIVVNVTSTPSAGVITSTVLETTTLIAPTDVSTATEVSTITLSETSISTTVSTASATTTSTSTSTSTIPAPASFIPIQSSLPGSSYSGAGGGSPVGNDPPTKRQLGGRAPLNVHGSERPHLMMPRMDDGTSPRQYTQGVKCIEYQPTSCATVLTTLTSTILAEQATSTSTVTSTLSITQTPSATSTVTSSTSTTITISSISTSVTTTTLTVTASTSTSVYAACATNNFADQAQGAGFGGYFGASNAAEVAPADSIYDCCVRAITNPTPVAIFFYQNGGTRTCFLGTQLDGSCPNPATNQAPAIRGEGTAFSLGNGYCGTITSVIVR